MSSIGVFEVLARVNGMPAFAAAFASSVSPRNQAKPAGPVGPIATGMPTGLPSSVDFGSRADVSLSTRERSLIRSSAARLWRSETSSSLPRSMNSNRPLVSRRFAMRRRSSMFSAAFDRSVMANSPHFHGASLRPPLGVLVLACRRARPARSTSASAKHGVRVPTSTL